jgi:hypothetical protein
MGSAMGIYGAGRFWCEEEVRTLAKSAEYGEEPEDGAPAQVFGQQGHTERSGDEAKMGVNTRML